MTYRDFVTSLRKLEIDRSCPLILHVSMSAFGEVHGGTNSIIGAISSCFDTWLTPAFTYKTMIVPEMGPPDNGMIYGCGKDTNRMAEIFRKDMPVDPAMGVFAEQVRIHPNAKRSTHPILSFAGFNAGKLLESQSIKDPLSPVQALQDAGGWAVLMGVDHTENISIHYAEQLSGRKQFIRWALTPKGVIPCRKFPGCSSGFDEIAPRLDGIVRKSEVGGVLIQAVPVAGLIDCVCRLLEGDPLALLCSKPACERCNEVRASVSSPE